MLRRVLLGLGCVSVIGSACARGAPPSAAVVASASSTPRAGSPPTASTTTARARCEAACERYSCREPVPNAVADCRSSQCGELSHAGEGALVSFATCIEQLTCADVADSLGMNEGPAGRCYVSAASGRRDF